MAAYANVVMVADSADVVPLMGANVNAGYTVAMQDIVGLNAEGEVCCLVRYDAVTNWAAIGAVEKQLMTKYVAHAIAIAGIAYDTSGYTSRMEAEDMINVLLYQQQKVAKLLQDQKVLTFIQGGSP